MMFETGREIASCRDVIDFIDKEKEKLIQARKRERTVKLKRFWFRGQAKADASWKLQPKGLRSEYRSHMQQMLTEFRAEATAIVPDPPGHDDLRQWCFLMQHYGMPTLLLDWTRSPLAALYFATNDLPETSPQDGVLWVLRPGLWNGRAVCKTHGALPEAYDKGLDSLFAIHFDRDIFKSREDKEHSAPDYGPGTVLSIEPIYNSNRMIAQQSVFTIHGPDSCPVEEMLECKDEPCVWKCVIPSANKGTVRQELYDLGVHVSALFPDLDNLSRCIKNRYSSS